MIVALFLARPVANLLDRWFSLAEVFGQLFSGEGVLDSFARDNGFILLLVFVTLVLFVVIRIILWLIKLKVSRMKERCRVFNRVDQICGLFLGIVRFIIYMTMLSTFLLFAESMTFLEWLPEWIFEDSTVFLWIYEQCIRVIAPLLNWLGS